MSFDFGKNRRSPPLARLLSYLFPGLGHFYNRHFFSGIMWVITACIYLYIFFILFSWDDAILDIEGIGFVVIYFCLCSFVGQQAANLSVDYNARQGLNEMIKKEKKKR